MNIRVHFPGGRHRGSDAVPKISTYSLSVLVPDSSLGSIVIGKVIDVGLQAAHLRGCEVEVLGSGGDLTIRRLLIQNSPAQGVGILHGGWTDCAGLGVSLCGRQISIWTRNVRGYVLGRCLGLSQESVTDLHRRGYTGLDLSDESPGS